MEEERLAGGRSAGAVRIGDAVHRPAQPWTPAVHAVLRHLEAVGFDGAPRVLGTDGRGREVLTHLAGDTTGEAFPWPAWVFSDTALVSVGKWARRLHDATESFVPPSGVRWLAGETWRPGLIVGHHDAAPWNAVWRDADLVGFFDWDTAGPSSREFADVVPARARSNADVIDRLAGGGDPVYAGLLPVAAYLRQAALEVEALPASFWTR
ncbi:hypothetical protein VT50_0209705 [Streptomyces antioxidans]|uniref:Aminoglycoside phosphotransferase domain-containing protein n=1 Tax=Streptomyces antioxidans TaxID=1507734 RepID=A0A1V4D842_9ACTN|nr:hypothetical protein [Streptomyces antioxidans]OPF81343.1 hypothetical protein VT50_0209705 [Streptomyces antioxidans]